MNTLPLAPNSNKVYIYIYIYIYREREREREREALDMETRGTLRSHHKDQC
jgi:hypothetical protein